jgi:hypothetical protein
MKKAGIKAANKVKANRKEKIVTGEIGTPNTPPTPSTPIDCGGWGGVSNAQTNGNNLIKPVKKGK